MPGSVDMNLGRKIDTQVGRLLLALLYGVSRLRARLGGPPQPPRLATTPPRAGAPPARPRRILAIKLYGLGNIAMLLPVLASLRRVHPDVEIDFLSLEENRSLLERSGLVERTVPVTSRGYAAIVRDLLRALWTIRRRRYDLVLDFEQFIKLSTILSYLSGAPERIGFNTDGQGRGALYTTRVVYRDGEHMQHVFARLLRPLQVEFRSEPLKLRISEQEREGAKSLLREARVPEGHRPLVAVHVGSGPNFYKTPLKRWPPEHFARLCDRLVEHRAATIVLTGKGSEEAALVGEVRSRMKHEAVDACDRLSIGELLALLADADLTISNDTSVMHLATLVETPVAAFFGPTDPLQYGPRNPHDLVLYRDDYCSPCLTNFNLKISYCTDPVCIRSIGVDETWERIDAQLAAIEAATVEVVS